LSLLKPVGLNSLSPKHYLMPKPNLLQIISHFDYKSFGQCFIK